MDIPTQSIKKGDQIWSCVELMLRLVLNLYIRFELKNITPSKHKNQPFMLQKHSVITIDPKN